jgi:hypothetical protein
MTTPERVEMIKVEGTRVEGTRVEGTRVEGTRVVHEDGIEPPTDPV